MSDWRWWTVRLVVLVGAVLLAAVNAAGLAETCALFTAGLVTALWFDRQPITIHITLTPVRDEDDGGGVELNAPDDEDAPMVATSETRH